ncbi:PAP/25A associated domain protein [Ancylostoma ceylanicum]|uniref:PAP/25A associated domain protein n=1 Tax=Ancylostoma ceylanicum TaxID=53326 RepID=A0A0D6LRG6_9BILA|nr:PAP/25A associated domain protein [Ancylostoma ceylanicum]
MSFFTGYLSRPTMQSLRRKWASADEEIDEVVNVCRRIEETMNSEQFCQLRTVPVLDMNPPEKAWARQLRLELRSAYNKERIQAVAGTSTSPAARSTIFTQQAQTNKTSKRKLSHDAINDTDSDMPAPKKRNKACQAVGLENGYVELDWADECDEDGLHFTYISPLSTSTSSSPSVVCLDNDEVENGCEASSSFSSQVNLDPEHSKNPQVLFIVQVEIDWGAVCVREKYPNEFKILDDEIWRHYELNRQLSRSCHFCFTGVSQNIFQTEEVYQWKMEVRNILLTEFRPAFPYQSIELFAVGSTVNGCGSYNSDMDLCLCIPMGSENVYSSERMAAVKILRRLNTIIKGKPSLRKIVRKSEVIPAKVPIIKMALHPPYEELDLDININNTAGIYNSHLIHYYSLLDSRFPAICLLVKHWAITNGIGDAASGSFNSYSLILLVLHYFQCGVQPAVLPNLQHVYPEVFGCTPPLERPLNMQTVGELLVGFFHYYATFDFENMAISMRNACVFSRTELKPDTFLFRVFIEEPFDRNNTARCVTKSYVMDRIERAFRQARDCKLRNI